MGHRGCNLVTLIGCPAGGLWRNTEVPSLLQKGCASPCQLSDVSPWEKPGFWTPIASAFPLLRCNQSVESLYNFFCWFRWCPKPSTNLIGKGKGNERSHKYCLEEDGEPECFLIKKNWISFIYLKGQRDREHVWEVEFSSAGSLSTCWQQLQVRQSQTLQLGAQPRSPIWQGPNYLSHYCCFP